MSKRKGTFGGLPLKRGKFVHEVFMFRRNGDRRARPRKASFRNGNGCGAGELKFFDTAVDDTIISTIGTIKSSVLLIAQGLTESTRVGRKICVRSIGWHFRLSIPPVQDAQGAPVSDIIRIILYIDKQTNGTAATVTDILQSADFQAFNNLANKGRFRTLMDRTYSMNYLAGIGVVQNQSYAAVQQHDTFYKRLTLPIEYSSTLGALAELRSNNIGVLTISEQGFGQLVSTLRVRYSDY